MDGTPGEDALLGLGDDLELVEDIHVYFDLDRQLDSIKK